MIPPKAFLDYLDKKGFRFFTGVPCSYFKSVIHYIEDHDHLSYVIAPNEGSALAIASGAALGGKSAAVMIQNSGLGNMVNPLTSLNAIYHIPVMIFISGRAYGIPDEPQHKIMGSKMALLLDALDIPHWDLPAEEEKFAAELDQGIRYLHQEKKPVVFFVRKSTFEAYPGKPMSNSYPMKRIDAISMIHEQISPEDLVFVTTGKPSREWFSVGDRQGVFYMQGSMGHIASLALGAALACPQRRIVAIDGDGAFLMHMGVVSAIGHYQPENFVHIVLDNESYESTGNQKTTSATTDFEAVAKAAGYRSVENVADPKALKRTLKSFLVTKGPSLLRVKINSLETKDIPRITARYTSTEITQNFIQNLQNR